MSQTAALYELQTLDTQIDGLHSRLAQIARQLDENAPVRQAQAALAESEHSYHEWRQRQKEMDQERTRLEAEATSTETRLYSGQVFNPREMTDLQDKVLELTHRRDALEEPVLEAMLQVEEQARLIIERRAALDRAQVEHAASSGELVREQAELSARLAELETESNQSRQGIEATNLALYDRLRTRPGGTVVVTLRGDDCGACGVGLTSQVAQQVRRGEVLVCPTCGRILYV